MQIGGTSSFNAALYNTPTSGTIAPAPNKIAPTAKTETSSNQNPNTPNEKSEKLDDLKSELKQKEAELEASELKEIEQLEARDREVRAHEAAHLAAAGGLAQGGPSFSYQKGPDGKQYAIGGEVKIDTSPVSGDPEATIKKAQTIRRAALAPSEPSGQDRAVAAQAGQMELNAQQELAKERTENSEEQLEQGSNQSASASNLQTPANESPISARNQRAINAFQQPQAETNQQFDLFA